MKGRWMPLVIGFAALLGCAAPDRGPASVRWGAEVCESCRMLITEIRFAAQYRSQDGRVHKFDDLVCLIRALRRETQPVREIWVIDETGRWASVEEVVFVPTTGRRGPMGGKWLPFHQAPPILQNQAIRWPQLLQEVHHEEGQ